MSPRNQHFRSWSEEITGTEDDEDLDNPVKSNTVEVLQKEGPGGHQVLMFLGQTQRDQLSCRDPADSRSQKGWTHFMGEIINDIRLSLDVEYETMTIISNTEISRDDDQTELEPHYSYRANRIKKIQSDEKALHFKDILKTSSTCCLLILESLTWIYLYTKSGNDNSGLEDLRETIVLCSLFPIIFNCVLCFTDHRRGGQASEHLPFFLFTLPAPILL